MVASSDTDNLPRGGRVRRLDPDHDAYDPVRARRRATDQRLIGRLVTELQGALAELLALLIPVECVCCEVEDTVLCGVCAQNVRHLCKQPFRAEQESPSLVDVNGIATLQVVAAGAYRDELARCLLSFKRSGQWRLADVLAPCLAKAVESAIGGRTGFLLVPIPTNGRAYRKRGFSPVHLLLLWVRLRRLLPHCASIDALQKKRSWPMDRLPTAVFHMLTGRLADVLPGRESLVQGNGQKGLGRGERARRVRGSMRVRRRRIKDIRGRECILIDDVLTTGATLAEAARAVKAAGGVVCGAVVLAATRPPAYAPFAAEDDPHGVIKTQSKNKWLKDE
ncbi:Predicted amidophosphoribosyltransferases [Arthrobacter sp. yr096]|nr:Predicted amidophosphoribosyltransferases [Arthrobacter sp. yr096]